MDNFNNHSDSLVIGSNQFCRNKPFNSTFIINYSDNNVNQID